MERGQFREKVREGLIVASLAGSVLIGAAACAEQCSGDKDCDGIADSVDRFPNFADPKDADLDGIDNGPDPYPYDRNNGMTIYVPPNTLGTPDKKTTTLPVPTTPRQTIPKNTPGRCTYGLKPDSDGDGTPDWCDLRFDWETHDSDLDGLVDAFDSCPANPDCDFDGQRDGTDPYPTWDEKRDDQQQQDKRDEQRRLDDNNGR